MKLRVLWNAGSSQQGCDENFILFWCQNLYVYCFFFSEIRIISANRQNKLTTLVA